MKIVFAGDSITDVGRTREEVVNQRPDTLGSGYPLLASSHILFSHPFSNIEFYNTAKSGNTIADLASSWKKEILALSPAILVILIGINDIWHEERAIGSDSNVFKALYKTILQISYKHNPNLKVVLLEPFWEGLVEGHSNLPGKEDWYEKLKMMQKQIEEISTEFPSSIIIKTQALFDKAGEETGPLFWTYDTVHPSISGHMLISKEVIKVLENLMF